MFPCSCPQGSGELNDKALFKERMSLLSQSAATPIHCLFEVSAGDLTNRPGPTHVGFLGLILINVIERNISPNSNIAGKIY